MMKTSVITTPVALAEPVDIDRLSKTIEYYSNGRFSSVFFENGTCVFPPVDGNKSDAAKKCLESMAGNNSFEVREMDDRNFIVKFTEEIFSVVFSDEFQRLKYEVIREINDSESSENIIGKDGGSDCHIYIGIFARTRLLEDVRDLRVVKELAANVL